MINHDSKELNVNCGKIVTKMDQSNFIIKIKLCSDLLTRGRRAQLHSVTFGVMKKNIVSLTDLLRKLSHLYVYQCLVVTMFENLNESTKQTDCYSLFSA